MTLAVLIVEDEPFARDDLCEIIEQCPELELRWQAASIAEASAILENHTPDVAYLDIQLRDGDAFDLMEKMPLKTKVVFTTGFDAYAVRAFEVNALDYLMKPVDLGRFRQSLARLLGPMAAAERLGSSALGAGDRVIVKCGNKQDLVSLESVVAVDCLGGNYTELCLSDQRRLESRRTVQQWESILPNDRFVRVRRSTIVNVHYVLGVCAFRSGGMVLQMKCIPKTIPVSRRLAPGVRAALERLSSVAPSSVAHTDLW
jgi:two-component system LytT family response regulator